MRTLFLILILFFLIHCVHSEEYLYILNDKCINELFLLAEKEFQNTSVKIIKDSRGIILRYKIEGPILEFQDLSYELHKKFEDFLSKIDNPAIIEVHVVDFPEERVMNLKKWEISTIIANNIEAIITKPVGTIEQAKINSIGYGEFLPEKNTPNNGGKSSNRVDIIVLCNISGE